MYFSVHESIEILPLIRYSYSLPNDGSLDISHPLIVNISILVNSSINCNPPSSGDWIINGTDVVVCENEANLILNGSINVSGSANLTFNNISLSCSLNNCSISLIENSKGFLIDFSLQNSLKSFI